MMPPDANIREAISRVEETLATANLGLQDLIDPKRNRRMSGLRNLLVFGRSTTFVLQNLRSVVGAEAFDAWYAPEVEAMKADPVMRYFVSARNDLEKQGKLHISTSTHVKAFNTNDIAKFGAPPAGATAFFIGDSLGGSGWTVDLPDGTTQKYYVEIPGSIAETTQTFSNFPGEKPEGFGGRSIDDLSTEYLAALTSLVSRAKAHFLHSESPTSPKPRQIPHLRIVK